MTVVTPLDQYGKPLIRALLRDEASPETIGILRDLVRSGNVAWTVDDVAAEIGAPIPVPVAAQVAARRRQPPRKRRS